MFMRPTKAANSLHVVQMDVLAGKLQRIKVRPGVGVQLVINGEAYTGQKQIKGRAVHCARRGYALEILLKDQIVAVIEDFFTNEGDASGQALALLCSWLRLRALKYVHVQVGGPVCLNR